MISETILFGMMMILAIVEIGLILSIRSLSKTMDHWSDLFKQAEEKIHDISSGIKDIKQIIKNVDFLKTGSLNLKGSTPFGEIDFDVKLGGKEK